MSERSDIAYILASADELEGYLLAEPLFWNLTPPRGYTLTADATQLTPGGLMLAERKTGPITNELSGAIDTVWAIRAKWASHWIKKAEKEFEYRLNQWQKYVTQFSQRTPSDYVTQIRGRTILDLLLQNRIRNKANKLEAIASLDSLIADKLINSDFIWSDTKEIYFPKDEFGYLYKKVAQ